MKQRMKTFGVLCAAALVLAAACNNSDDGSSANGDSTTYAVGNIVTFEGKDYLVTKNTETAARSAARAAVNSDTGLYYQNKQAAAYREQWLQTYGVTEYVELFDITTKRAETTKGQACLDDKYLVLQDNKKVFITQQSWKSETIFPDRDANKHIEKFNALTEDQIRQTYDPDYFYFQNYPSNASEKIKIEYAFNRNDDGTTNFDSLKKTKTFKAYVSMPDGKLHPIYNNQVQTNGYEFYSILDSNIAENNFFYLWFTNKGTFYLSAEGTGEPGGSTSKLKYQNKVTINKALYDTTQNKVAIQYTVEKTVGGTPVAEENKTYTFGQEPNKDNTYVHVSDETTPITTYDVPKEITFSAPYQDTSVALNAYTSVTFVPEEKDGKIIYLPKTDEQYEYDFIAQYAKDCVSLYNQ